MTPFLIVMGVSGCGKSTIGQQLANRLGCAFYDADDFHPPANVVKMGQGIPLTDADRQPWLARLQALIATEQAQGHTAVLACSALKQAYRQQLRAQQNQVRFIYLAGTFELILTRLQARQGHYMKSDLLQSQFDALEEPTADEALIIDAAQPVETILDTIQRQL